jgi:large repetitive protein
MPTPSNPSTIAVPTNLALEAADDSGLSSSDNITRQTTGLTITGKGVNGSFVTLYDNGGTTAVGSGYVANGVFRIDVSLAAGVHNLTAKAKVGSGGLSSQSAALTVSVDTAAAAAPIVKLAADTGIAGDLYTSKRALDVQSEAGALVEYSNDNKTWARNFKADEGKNTVFVRQTDVAGNVSQSTRINFTLDTQADSAPLVSLRNDTGISGDKLTSDRTLIATGYDKEKGAVIQYSLDGTNWMSEASYQNAKLNEGANSVYVRFEDRAGNISPGTRFDFVLDTQADGAPIVALIKDSGTIGDNLTNDATLMVGGYDKDKGAAIQFSLNGNEWISEASYRSIKQTDGDKSVFVRFQDKAGNLSAATKFNFVLDTQADSAPLVTLGNDTGINGDKLTNDATLRVSGLDKERGAAIQYSLDNRNWISEASYNALKHADGAKTVYVRFEDRAGNISASTRFDFTLDTQANASPAVSLTTDSGALGDKITNDGSVTVIGYDKVKGDTIQFSLNGTDWMSEASYKNLQQPDGAKSIYTRAIDLAGNISQATPINFILDRNAPAPAVKLRTDSGDLDLVTNDGTLDVVTGEVLPSTILYSTDGGKTWSTSFVAAEGKNSIQVKHIDIANNVSAATSFEFTLDRRAPATPVLALAEDTGTSGDMITKNGAIKITGQENGTILEYSVNGGAWTNSFTPPAADGKYAIRVHQINKVGNKSADATLEFTLDRTIAAPAVGLSIDSGIANDLITNKGDLKYLAGFTPENGALVEYSIDNGARWSKSFLAKEGNNAVMIRQTDVAQNTSAATAFSFTLDTVAPNAPALVLASDTGIKGDNITSYGGLVLGAVEKGARVEYSLDGTIWTTSLSAPKDGSNTYFVRQTDVAGNVSATGKISFALDTVAPASPILRLASDSGVNTLDKITNKGEVIVTGIETGARVEYGTLVGKDLLWSDKRFTAAEGKNAFAVRQTDTAGNSAMAEIAFTLDTKVDAPAVVLAKDSGIANDKVTNDGSLAVKTETGAAVTYSVDGGKTWIASPSPVGAMPNGAIDSFLISHNYAQDGAQSVLVRQTDIAGNVSAATKIDFMLDRTADIAPVVTLKEDTGVSGDFITSKGALNIVSAAGSTVEHSIDNGKTWVVGVPKSDAAMKDGSQTILVHQKDLAGNISADAKLSYTLDTVAAPPVLGLSLDAGGKPGINVSGLETGAKVEYTLNGGALSSVMPTAVDGNNVVAVKQTDIAGNASPLSTMSFTVGDPMANTGAGVSHVAFGQIFASSATLTGTSGNDTVKGTSAAQLIAGGDGNDLLIGGGGADSFYGGAGDDIISVADLSFKRADGGSGTDTLRYDGPSARINAGDVLGKISGVETLDITGTGNTLLAFSLDDLMKMYSAKMPALTIEGNAGDFVAIGQGWTDKGIVSVVGQPHHVYSYDVLHLELSINTAVMVVQ